MATSAGPSQAKLISCDLCLAMILETDLKDHPTEETMKICEPCEQSREKKLRANKKLAKSIRFKICNLCGATSAKYAVTVCVCCDIGYCGSCIKGSCGRRGVAASQIAGWECWHCEDEKVSNSKTTNQQLSQVFTGQVDHLAVWLQKALDECNNIKTVADKCPQTKLTTMVVTDAANACIKINACDAKKLSLRKNRDKVELVQIFLRGFETAGGKAPPGRSKVVKVYNFFKEVAQVDQQAVGEYEHFKRHWKEMSDKAEPGIPTYPN